MAALFTKPLGEEPITADHTTLDLRVTQLLVDANIADYASE
jgi:hypothetical protein